VRTGGTPKTEEEGVNVTEVGGVGSWSDAGFEEVVARRVDGDREGVRRRDLCCEEGGSQVEMDGKREGWSSGGATSALALSSSSV
jgi:hypothetical protein